MITKDMCHPWLVILRDHETEAGGLCSLARAQPPTASWTILMTTTPMAMMM
jgi:hypothetical protein